MKYKKPNKLSKFVLLGICISLPLYGNVLGAAEPEILIHTHLNTPSITTEFTPASIKVGEEFEYWVATSHQEDKSLRFKLANTPKGMRIHSKSGVLTWTATMNQSGDFYPEIILLKNKVELDRQYLQLNVEDADINYKGVFVSLKEKASFEDGSPEYPFSTIKTACSSVAEGENIYIRGGRYINPGNKTAVVRCKGGENKNQYITVQPWGNEQVQIDFNGSSGIAVRDSAYTIIKGFEIKGENQSITYKKAIANWWKDKDRYSGTGIRISEGSELTHHIIIKDNIVHDAPAGGIKSGYAAHITLQNNIVYNCVWWTMQGTKGMAISLAQKHENDTDNSKYYNKMVGNLVFANESRIFSRVWRKGAATLNIDEGGAMHIQERKTGLNLPKGYTGRYLIKNNFMLYNGKSLGVNMGNRVDIKKNSFYLNGTTAMGKKGFTASGVRLADSDDIKFISNAIEADLDVGLLYSASDTVTNVVVKNSFGYGHVLNAQPLPNGFYQVDQPLFEDPQNLDFSIINSPNTKIGAHQDIMEAHKVTLKRYGIQVKPSHYVVDNQKMVDDILKYSPGKKGKKKSDNEGEYILISNIPKNHISVKDTGSTKFKLYL